MDFKAKRQPLLLGHACALYLLATLGTSDAAPLKEATITRVVNEVEVIPEGAPPEPATLGEVVSGLSSVRTGGKSRAQLTFTDQTLARLGANTLFSFERGTRSLDLERGTILLEVPKNAGGATIRSAPITAAITGTTLMMEYSPGSPGAVKVIVLEGTVRLALTARLGESVLIGPGQMIAVAANARSLPDPMTIDVKHVMQTSKLVKEGKLESKGLILETVQAQQEMLADGRLSQGNPDFIAQQPGAPGLINATVANAVQNRQDVRPQGTGLPPQPPVPPPTPPPTPPPYDPGETALKAN